MLAAVYTGKRTLRRLFQHPFGMPLQCCLKYFSLRPSLKNKTKLCAMPIRGQQPPTMRRRAVPLVVDNNAADPFCTSGVSDLPPPPPPPPPHLSLPASTSAPSPSYPFTSGRPRGASVRNICSSVYPGHTQRSLLNSGSCGALHRISNVASRGNKLLASASSITVQGAREGGKTGLGCAVSQPASPRPHPSGSTSPCKPNLIIPLTSCA